ncbi:MAG TPA: hydroxymethylpyrimidine/phosphomethylpyrimidine kinase [Bacteroidia bacterium]|nr:hydroxymethylpyrimidine/phosphomethylpyrimidine kinase [Bacteroidia bacterium]
MAQERTCVLSLAGFDPSGGAGLLADIKTFEQHKVYGLSISTANTLQTENKFHSIEWEKIESVLNALNVMLSSYSIEVIKIGIVPSFDYLSQLVNHIKNKNAEIKIVVDPIIKSSTGFDFQKTIDKEELISVLKNIYLITPNMQEAMLLTNTNDSKEAAKQLSEHCNVLLKGGHNEKKVGVDYLYKHGDCIELKPTLNNLSAKHGSGCVLSAAIVSNLALGIDLKTACIEAKKYVEHFLNSNKSLLGFHHV